jgi:serine/threonine protein kinase
MGEQAHSRGRLVGRYVVHDRIAAGGMATVHVGRLLGAAGFSRTVAIKRLHDAYAKDTDFVAMLLDEARLAAMIRHPNVVPTLDVVAEEDELLVVMEYVEGDSVAHLIKLTLDAGQRVPATFAAAIATQALHGLHAAHEARDRNGEPLGIVHRDVSPQNILVGVDGVSRVLDFGIAKAASRATATEDGQLKGKTAYMAPEQLHHGAVDRRTDIFAASVVLWELLCGRRLFFADSPAEMMSRVLTSPIDNPQKYAPHVPPELAAITLRGLDRDPAGRFATAEEMALAIEDAIAMPRPKDIGSWVSTIAKLTLEARAQLVQIVEASSHRMPAAQQTSDPVLAKAIEEAERRRANAEMATDVGGRMAAAIGPPIGPVPQALVGPPPGVGEESTGIATVQSTIHPVKQRPPTSRAAVALAVGGGLALILALSIALVITSGAMQKQRGDATPPAGATAVDPVVSAAPGASASSASTGAGAPAVASSAPVASATASITKPPTTTNTTRPPTVGTRPPEAAPSKKCDIDYFFDAQGHKHFKPECVGP